MMFKTISYIIACDKCGKELTHGEGIFRTPDKAIRIAYYSGWTITRDKYYCPQCSKKFKHNY